MIVRISGEGQFELPDERLDALNELDNLAVVAADSGDEPRFLELWAQMLELVTTEGTMLSAEELVESAIILPPRDTTFEEARADFTGEGLIPD